MADKDFQLSPAAYRVRRRLERGTAKPEEIQALSETDQFALLEWLIPFEERRIAAMDAQLADLEEATADLRAQRATVEADVETLRKMLAERRLSWE